MQFRLKRNIVGSLAKGHLYVLLSLLLAGIATYEYPQGKAACEGSLEGVAGITGMIFTQVSEVFFVLHFHQVVKIYTRNTRKAP